MIYKTRRYFVVVGNTTREPTEEEARTILAFLELDELLPLGVWPVDGVGDVWFQRVPVLDR